MNAAEIRRPFDVPLLEDLPDPAGRRVLVRADLDIPPTEDDDLCHVRHVEQLGPTLEWLFQRGAEVTVSGHQGPLGSTGDPDRFARTAKALTSHYPKLRVLPNLAEGERPFSAAHETTDGHRADGADLLDWLLEGQELFVNDDFQWCATPLVSVVGPPTVLPSAAGRRLQADLELLAPMLAPERPFVVVIGSRSVLDRLRDLQALVLRADAVLVGAQMSHPFFVALGKQPPGDEPPDFIEECRRAYGVAHEILHDVVLPLDLVWERDDGTMVVAKPESVIAGSIADIGPRTAVRYAEVLRGARRILWMGALGKLEDARFAEGTLAVARSLSKLSAGVVVGGDALVRALREHRLLPESAGVVSATGSTIALLKDGDLPGLAALRRAPRAGW